MGNRFDDLTRRELFGRAAGVGAGIALTGLWPAVAHATHCHPPTSSSAPVPWAGDTRPIVPRRPATTLTTAERDKLKAAYKALKDLQASDPTDPRGFAHQANIHCFFCAGNHSSVSPANIHGSWTFFAWHRAELYFHERILGHLVGDPNLRLPYWTYENAAHRKIPPVYADPADGTNACFNATRGMDPTEELPAFLVEQSVFDNLNAISTFTAFGGNSTTGGAGEGTPHGAIHNQVGGDMGTFAGAGKDPLFYAHHGRIDKIWSDWRKADASHTDPASSSFLNLSFNFYDENKVWTSIKFADVLDHENKLRYTYGGPKFFIRPEWLKFLKIQPKIIKLPPLQERWQFDPTIVESLKKGVQAGKRYTLQMRQISLPKQEFGTFFVYANEKLARENAGPGTRGYLGYVAKVPNSKEDPGDPKLTAVFDATKHIDVLTQDAAPHLMRYQRVRKGEPVREAKPIRLVAQDVKLLER